MLRLCLSDQALDLICHGFDSLELKNRLYSATSPGSSIFFSLPSDSSVFLCSIFPPYSTLSNEANRSQLTLSHFIWKSHYLFTKVHQVHFLSLEFPQVTALPTASVYIAWKAIFLACRTYSLRAFPHFICYPMPKPRPRILGLCYGTTYFLVAVFLLSLPVCLTSLRKASLHLLSWHGRGPREEVEMLKCFFLFNNFFIVFFNIQSPYTPTSPSNHHTVVHVHESFSFLLNPSTPSPPPQPSSCSPSMSLSPFSSLVQFVHQIPHMSEIIASRLLTSYYPKQITGTSPDSRDPEINSLSERTSRVTEPSVWILKGYLLG